MATLTHRQPLPRVALVVLAAADSRQLSAARDGRAVPFCVRRVSALLGAQHFLSRRRLHHQSARAVLSWCCASSSSACRKRFRWRFRSRCLFAALLAMGRVMGDNEVTAMRTAGIPVMRIALSPLLFGVAMFVIAYGMNEWRRAGLGRSFHAERSIKSSTIPTRCRSSRSFSAKIPIPATPFTSGRSRPTTGRCSTCRSSSRRSSGRGTRRCNQDGDGREAAARAARRYRHALQQRRLRYQPATRQRTLRSACRSAKRRRSSSATSTTIRGR